MNDRASQLILELGLEPHPEGGRFRRVHRSGTFVQPLQDPRPERAALTTIYFLLVAGECSRWHRVMSDEIWHFYEGAPLELFSMGNDFAQVGREVLGPVGGEARPTRVVPAGEWQAARSLGEYTLAGCTVGPGFEFEDFSLLGEIPDEVVRFRSVQPQWAIFL